MIDVNSGEEKLHINLDITIEKVPCAILSLDIVDVTGVHVVDIEGKLHKYRLDETGKELGMMKHIDEDGHTDKEAAKNINNTEHQQEVSTMVKSQRIYEETVEGLKNKEGCKLSGFVFINKVPGNFHISMHHYPEAVQMLYMNGKRLDFTHKINHLSFGNMKDIEFIQKNYKENFKFELDGRYIEQDKYMRDMGMMGGLFGPQSLDTNYFLEIS